MRARWWTHPAAIIAAFLAGMVPWMLILVLPPEILRF
jgi:hypothetical protein